MPRDKNRQFAPRTDTKIVAVAPDYRNGSTYYRREDGSYFPKQTTIALNQPTKFLLAKLKDIGGYANYSELLLEMLASLFTANSLPELPINKADESTVKRLMNRAVNATTLQSGARKRAIHKGRYNKKRRGVEIDEEIIFEPFDSRVDVVDAEKRRMKGKKGKEKILDKKAVKRAIKRMEKRRYEDYDEDEEEE